jgi:hypothetical protein
MNSVILILYGVLLPHEIEVRFQNVEEKTEVGQRLTDAVVGKFGTSLEHLMDTLSISKRVREEEAAAEKN